MTALAAAATTRRPSRSPRRALAWHPEWWVYAVAALAWIDLELMSMSTMGAGQHAMAMPAGSATFLPSWADAWSDWVLMVVATALRIRRIDRPLRRR